MGNRCPNGHSFAKKIRKKEVQIKEEEVKSRPPMNSWHTDVHMVLAYPNPSLSTGHFGKPGYIRTGKS